MKVRTKLEQLINSGIPIFGGLMLSTMVGLTFLQIVLREFFNSTLNWSDELSQFCMTWLALIGSIWATKNNQHLNTGLKLYKNLNDWKVRLIDSIIALAIVVTAALVAYQSIIFALQQWNLDSLSLPWIKMGYIFIALPLFMIAVCYYYLKSFFKNIFWYFQKR
jgi:TRAP-type C4-dicarboxylate transport system permease small subunit